MNLPHFIKSTLIIASLLTAVGSAQALPLTYSSDAGATGKLSCEVTVDHIGNLTFRKGLASVHGNSITIQSTPSEYMPPVTELSGVILRVEASLDVNPQAVTGLVYFQGGDSLKQLDDSRTLDLIFKHDGALSGRIAALKGYDLNVIKMDGSTAILDVSTVKYVRSPRAFVFTIPISGKVIAPDTVAFQREAYSAKFKATVNQSLLKSSSIVPGHAASNQAGLPGSELSKYGDGTSLPNDDSPGKDVDDDDPGPSFHWQMPGLPGRQFPYQPNRAGGI
jgi:hypothetical protein